MALRDTTSPTVTADLDETDQTDAYVPPRVERLGSLAELTLGGDNAHDDGNGGAGDEGSV